MKQLYKAHGSAEIVFLYDPSTHCEDVDPDEVAQQYLDDVESLEMSSVERIYEEDDLPAGWTLGDYPHGDDDMMTIGDTLNGEGSYTDIQTKLKVRGYDVPIEVLKEIL